jgi:hypothetical protein
VAYTGRLGEPGALLGLFQLGGVGEGESTNKTLGDVGAAVDASFVAAAIICLETGVGLEVLDAPIEYADDGAGTDTATVGIVAADSASGLERDDGCPPITDPIVRSFQARDDSAVSIEIGETATTAEYADSGSASEAVYIEFACAATDAAEAAEVTLSGPATDDSGAGSEAGELLADQFAGDAVAATETPDPLQAFGTSDAGSGSDIFIPIGDGFGNFTAELSVAVDVSETGEGGDIASPGPLAADDGVSSEDATGDPAAAMLDGSQAVYELAEAVNAGELTDSGAGSEAAAAGQAAQADQSMETDEDVEVEAVITASDDGFGQEVCRI